MPKKKKVVKKNVKTTKKAVGKVAEKVSCDHVWFSNPSGTADERYVCQKCGEKSA